MLLFETWDNLVQYLLPAATTPFAPSALKTNSRKPDGNQNIKDYVSSLPRGGTIIICLRYVSSSASVNAHTGRLIQKAHPQDARADEGAAEDGADDGADGACTQHGTKVCAPLPQGEQIADDQIDEHDGAAAAQRLHQAAGNEHGGGVGPTGNATAHREEADGRNNRMAAAEDVGDLAVQGLDRRGRKDVGIP